jgi:peptide chain release factor 3
MQEYGLPVEFRDGAVQSVCRWISSADKADLERFVTTHRGDIARDLDGDPVFLAADQFSLNYEAERWKMIEMVAIKEYHVAKAA